MVAFRRAYVAAAIGWTIALPLGTWIASRAHASRAASALAIAIYGIGSIVCHQLRERSFHLWSAQLPVCARCTGIYLGAAASALIQIAPAFPACALRAPARLAGAPSARRRQASVRAEPTASAGPSVIRSPERLARQPGVPRRLVLVLAALPSLATFIYEWTTGDAPSNWIRFGAGLPLGGVVSWLMLRPSAMLRVDVGRSEVE